MKDIHEVLYHFDGVKQTSSNEWMAQCPAHDDRNASLSISTGKDGKALFHCHAGCETSDILNAIGLTFKDIMPEKPQNAVRTPRKIVATYDYPHAQKIRYEPKSFAWRHKDSGGEWVYNRKDIPHELYIRGTSQQTMYFVEGEKDVDTMAKLGFYAACNEDGADKNGKGKWYDTYNDAFKGKSVRIIVDNDETGRTFSASVADRLTGITRDIKLFDLRNVWEDAPEHADITDYYDEFGADATNEALFELERIAESCTKQAESSVEFTNDILAELGAYTISSLTEEERRPPEFLVDNLVPVGLTFLSGAPKIRKSFMALQIAAAVAKGLDFLGFSTKQCDVVYFDLEGSKSRTATRSEKMTQQVPDNVYMVHKTDFKLADGLVDTIQALHKQKPNIRLFIIDTYSRARGVVKSSGANAYDADVALLEPLQRMAIEEGIAVLCIHHDKKGAGMVQDSFERLSGTMGISGSADCVLNLVADGKRFEGKAKFEYSPRDAKGGEINLTFNPYLCEWQKDIFEENDIIGNPIVAYCINNAPEKNREGEFISYEDVYRGSYKIAADKPGDEVARAIKTNRDEIYSKYGVGVQVGVQSHGRRGIRLFRIV